MPELKIQESHDDAVEPKVLYLDGFVDSATVFDLKKKLDEILSRSVFRLILDLGKLTYIGSAGISIFLEYSSRFQGSGGALILCSVPEKARRVMTMVGMDSIVRIFDTQKDALAFLQPDSEKPEKTIQQGKEEKKEFPITGACPHCQKTGTAVRSDIFRCPSCQKLFFISESGAVFPLPLHEDTSLQKGKWFKLKVPSNIIYLNSVRAFLTSVLGESGISDTDISDIEIAVDEAVSNVMEHAYGMDKTKQVDISILLTDEYVLIKLRDIGETFDLVAKIREEEKTVQSTEKRGRGCFIIQNVMDKLEYQTIPGAGNELVMLRYFKRHQSEKSN